MRTQTNLVLAAMAVTFVTAGCATKPPERSCSGRITTDNGHVVRNEEDCRWGPQYSQIPTQTVYVVQQPAYVQQYVAAPPPPPVIYAQPYPVYGPPGLNIGGLILNFNGSRRRR